MSGLYLLNDKAQMLRKMSDKITRPKNRSLTLAIQGLSSMNTGNGSTPTYQEEEDKKKQRAKRFGLTGLPSEEEQKRALRHKRFGSPEKKNPLLPTPKTQTEDLEELQKREQRAKRFGLPSQPMALATKMEQRRKRFGSSQNAPTSTDKPPLGEDHASWQSKLLARQLRFGTVTSRM